MTEAEPWTVGRLINWTTDYFKTQGFESARLDAEVLLAEARGCQRIELYTAFDTPAAEEVKVAFRELVRRRAEGAPVAYLVGHKEFYSLEFRVTPDVLIPRPETEHLLVELLDLAKEYTGASDTLQIADIGTGSGVLAACAAKHISNCLVRAVDVSKPALDIAAANVKAHGVDAKVQLIEGDLFSAFADPVGFDFVVSNPPYVSQAEYDALDPGVREFEPRTALVAGEQGTDVYERLIPQAAEHLKPGGWLLLEIGPSLVESVPQLINQDGRFEVCVVSNDLAGLPRVAKAQRCLGV